MKKFSHSHALRFLLFALCLLPFLAVSCASPQPQKISRTTPLEWSQRLAYSQMARETNAPKWDYTMGLFTFSLLKLNKQVPDARFVKFSENKIGSLISSNGIIQGYKLSEYQLDALNPGKTALALWQETREERYLDCARLLCQQLKTQPRTSEGGFWHKQRYTNQMWLDGIYMAAPFYAEYVATTVSNPALEDFDDVVEQFRLIDVHTYDVSSGLNYHAWDASKTQPWANPQTGCSSNFWGRAEGWYAMALVDTLDFLPTNHPVRCELIAMLQATARGLVKWQDSKTGLWWQVLDQGGRKGNYFEATANAMFVYALAKGVNKGYLPQEYAIVAQRGYEGIVKNLIVADGKKSWSLTHCCQVAGLGFTNSAGRARDGSFDYYVSEPVVKNDLKGVGPFILAGIEVQELH
ncbi:MAG TPA: glycoside hydrolase family 88 protein [Candidatus Sulfotelmatobacter sp.]|jgi:unsaturated rhamnogalacturonyl hydrolase|nr:glycoside hydrolase family 88 protein [Candidatus Sulfotelmatobacter sp.]